MNFNDILFWFGAIIAGLLGVSAMFAALLFSLLWIEKFFRELWAWAILGELDEYICFKQFKSRYIFEESMCPHCGGSGLKDDDEATKEAIWRLKKIARRHDRNVEKEIERRNQK